MKNLITILCLCLFLFSCGDNDMDCNCFSGDCENGHGLKFCRDEEGSMTLLGDFKNGSPHGSMFISFDDKNVVYGDWIDGKLDGCGTMVIYKESPISVRYDKKTNEFVKCE